MWQFRPNALTTNFFIHIFACYCSFFQPTISSCIFCPHFFCVIWLAYVTKRSLLVAWFVIIVPSKLGQNVTCCMISQTEQKLINPWISVLFALTLLYHEYGQANRTEIQQPTVPQPNCSRHSFTYIRGWMQMVTGTKWFIFLKNNTMRHNSRYGYVTLLLYNAQ
jgi:hypothetical protein